MDTLEDLRAENARLKAALDAERAKANALQMSIDFARLALVKFGNETMRLEDLAIRADQARAKCEKFRLALVQINNREFQAFPRWGAQSENYRIASEALADTTPPPAVSSELIGPGICDACGEQVEQLMVIKQRGIAGLCSCKKCAGDGWPHAPPPAVVPDAKPVAP